MVRESYPNIPSSGIHWMNGEIHIYGSLSSEDVFSFSKSAHILIEKQGYRDVILNFSRASIVRESFMVPVISLVRNYRMGGISFSIILPDNVSGKNIFHNANWSYLIDDTSHAQTTFDGVGHLPASSFRTSTEQGEVVDRVMSMILKVIPLQRNQLKALEWSVNEITDNVLNHSQSSMGGVIQASRINSGGRTMVEFVVSDAGIGIQKSLNENNGVRALERAIKEGVTRNPATNQGNGLYGTFRVSTLSNGRFELHSSKASLIASGSDKVRAFPRASGIFPGTLVVCRIGCDDEKLIENALMFKGKVHKPGFDYIEKKFESENSDMFTFIMREQCQSFGSRESGVSARTIIENLLRAEPNYPLTVDFSGVGIISSSFADEVFGRLFVELGPIAFMSRVNIINIDSSLRAILDRSISLRMSQSISSW